MKIKLNNSLKGHKTGEVISIEDKAGVPTDIYWRNRLKDSAVDNCIEIIVENKKSVVLEKKGTKKIVQNVTADVKDTILEVKNDNNK